MLKGLKLMHKNKERRQKNRSRMRSTWARVTSEPQSLAKNPARILPKYYDFDSTFRVVMSLQGTYFGPATGGAHVLTPYAHMLPGWEPADVYTAGKSSPNSSAVRVHWDENKEMSKKRDESAPTPRVPQQLRPPAPDKGADKVQRAFEPPRAGAGDTATVGQGREVMNLLGTSNFRAARANQPTTNRPRTRTEHMKF